MFEHIIIPLDGSALAECVLPLAGFFSGALKSKVTLLHIIEEDAPPLVHGDRHITATREAEVYLQSIRQLYFSSQADITCHVHTTATRNVVDGILTHQSELNPDLVIMATHGRGGVRELIFGSIAQQVVESGQTPVLIIRPEAAVLPDDNRSFSILAAVDNDPEHSDSLSVAFQLASAVKSRLHIIGIVPTMSVLAGRHATLGKYLPGAMYHVLELAESELLTFLTEKTRRLQRPDIECSINVGRGDPTTLITETAARVAADMIILGTHGRAGATAFWSGSIAAKVVKQTLRPLLLVPV